MDTCVRWIAAAMHLEGSYAKKLLIPRTGGRFLTTEKDYPLQTGHKNFDYHRGESAVFRVCEVARGVQNMACTWKSKLRVSILTRREISWVRLSR